ncbi:MAG TPA: hypothetical protein VJG67_03260 [Candidatus Paceibacterota bacterium]|nr:MAG: hypothetical protein A3J17_00685 [Candidatus Curtissbacteria bacterium RIFCSPLOWO2_02_FULL_40_11]
MKNNSVFSNQIYGFALSGGSGRILYRLRQIDCYYLVYPNNVEHYLEMLLRDQPPYVLGLGTYSGVDQDQIRIETVCTNKFRNDYVDGMEKQKITINSFLHGNSQIKLAEAVGNSHCNLVSWRIMQLINQGKLNAQYTFLHIPKNMRPWVAIEIIDQKLIEFKQALH